jgi:iron complex transport system ATP-binding protein
MINLNAVAVTLDDKPILEDITLHIAEQSYWVIVGPNGSGKSTLLKTIMGIHKAYTGQIEYDGKSLHNMSQRDWARIVSYVPQSSGRHLPFRVDEFLKMSRYAHQRGEWRPEDQQAVDQALDITQTSGFKDRHMATLSGGEAQRVMIAAAIAQQTQAILLDEPTSYLDPHHQVEVHQLIEHLNQALGLTVIEVSHDINHAAHANKNVLALLAGRSFWQGSGDAFLEKDRLQSLYQQDFVFLPHPHSGRTLALAEAR